MTKLAAGHDKVLIRVSADSMYKLGLRLFLSARGDVLCRDPVPVTCFLSAAPLSPRYAFSQVCTQRLGRVA